jgi:hypothetical protein
MHALAAQIRSIVVRGKVALSKVSGRTLLQVTALDDDVHDQGELVLPPGYVALPKAGADVLELQISGQASHKVYIAGDHTDDAVVDLKTGEYGISSTGQSVILRVSGTELVSALLKWGPTRDALKRLITEAFEPVYNMHTHNDPQGGVSAVPNQQMTAAHLTGGS